MGLEKELLMDLRVSRRGLGLAQKMVPNRLEIPCLRIIYMRRECRS